MHPPLIFNGGLGMEPRSVGLALAILGFFGIASRLGNVQCFRIFCTAFPIAYGLSPFLAIIPSGNSIIIWILSLVLMIHTTGRIFVLPATIVLLNNFAPEPSVLGMIHGIRQTTSALFRTLGPICAGLLLGSSLEHGIIGVVWWIFAAIAIFGWVASLFIWERTG